MSNYSIFVELLKHLEEKLKEISINKPRSIICKKGEEFEIVVYNLLNEIIISQNLEDQIQIKYTEGSHTFPDIVFEFDNSEKFGLEVKLSTSKSKSWKTNGNSIVGSTRDKEVKDIFIIFGKMPPSMSMQFKVRKYEDTVTNVVVTHSPRYLIDMNSTEETNFFIKSGLTFDQMLGSEDPISLITNYYSNLGEKAWWLSKSTPATFKLLSELSINERSKFVAEGFVFFPEIFSDCPMKYKDIAFWMITERSIFTPALRDQFTAGGRIDISLNGRQYNNMPKKYDRLLKHIHLVESVLNETCYEDLNNYWKSVILVDENIEKKKAAWKQLILDYANIESEDIKDFVQNII